MKVEIMQLEKKVEASAQCNDVKMVTRNIALTVYRYVVRYVFCNVARYVTRYQKCRKICAKKNWGVPQV